MTTKPVTALLPPIYPGEALRSYYERVMLLNRPLTNSIEMGSRFARWHTPDWCLPTGLNLFAEAYGAALGWKDGMTCLVDHTLAPYFECTMPLERRARFESRLLYVSMGPRRPMLAKALSEWFLKSAVLCIDCENSAAREVGFSYIRRHWLVPFATRCPIHGTLLAMYPLWNALVRGPARSLDTMPGRRAAGRSFSTMSSQLLNGGVEPLENVRRLLHTRGFVSTEGRIRRDRLSHALIHYAKRRYEHAELSELLSSDASVTKLLVPLWSKRGALHPALMLVLIEALEDMPERVPAAATRQCRLSRANVVAAFRGTRSGTKAAAVAGVSVQTALVHGRAEGIEISRRPKVIKKALVHRIETLLASGMKVKDVAVACSVSLSSVYRVRQSNRALSQLNAARNDGRHQDLVWTRQQRWESLLHANPTANLAELKALAPADFAFLYRNAMEWLQAHKPQTALPQARQNLTSRMGSSRTPSGADFALACRMQECAAASEARSQDAARKTASKLLTDAGRREVHLEQSPESSRFLELHSESLVSYVRRRLEAAANRLSQSEVMLGETGIIREARLRTQTVHKSAVDVQHVANEVRARWLKDL